MARKAGIVSSCKGDVSPKNGCTEWDIERVEIPVVGAFKAAGKRGKKAVVSRRSRRPDLTANRARNKA